MQDHYGARMITGVFASASRPPKATRDSNFDPDGEELLPTYLLAAQDRAEVVTAVYGWVTNDQDDTPVSHLGGPRGVGTKGIGSQRLGERISRRFTPYVGESGGTLASAHIWTEGIEKPGREGGRRPGLRWRSFRVKDNDPPCCRASDPLADGLVDVIVAKGVADDNQAVGRPKRLAELGEKIEERSTGPQFALRPEDDGRGAGFVSSDLDDLLADSPVGHPPFPP